MISIAGVGGQKTCDLSLSCQVGFRERHQKRVIRNSDWCWQVDQRATIWSSYWRETAEVDGMKNGGISTVSLSQFQSKETKTLDSEFRLALASRSHH